MTYLQGPKSAETVEKEQEAKLKAKYGNLGAKKKLMPKVCFVLAIMLEAAVLQVNLVSGVCLHLAGP